MTSLAFILPYPWGLYDNSSRKPLNLYENSTSANWPFLLATTGEVSVRLKNRRVPPQAEGLPFKWSDYMMRFYSIPAVTQHERQNLSVLLDDGKNNQSIFPVEISHSVARPKDRSNGNEIEDDLEAGKLTGLLKTMFQRIHDIIETAGGEDLGKNSVRLSWEEVAHKILTDTEDSDEPQMDLIVKHAKELHKTVSNTAERPRRVLNRVRRMMSVTKIQELDSACLTDYIRRPGITPAQKAGPRQELLGIDRQEIYDTVENRVLKDFLKRSYSASRMYLRAFRKYGSSNRFITVQQYGMACRRLGRDHSFDKVSALAVKPTANYVLLFDPSYHKIWLAYEELLKLETKEDDAWRWQARLWTDIGLVIMHSTLVHLAKERGSIPAISPLYLKREQSRGRWTDDDNPQSAFFLLDISGKRIVAAPLDTRTHQDHPKITPWQLSLGVSMVIHLEEVGSRSKAYILVWTIHSTGSSQPAIDEVVSSAQDSLKKCRDHVQTYKNENIEVRGIVLQSNRDLDTVTEVADCGIVSGICFAPVNSKTPETLGLIGKRIERYISELFK